MARRIAIPSKDVQVKIVGPTDALTVPRVQRLTMTADRPSTDIDELGNRLHAGTIEDIPAITVTFQAMDVGMKLVSVLTGVDYATFPDGSGVSLTEAKELDVIVQVKNDTIEDYVKMAHARKCTIRDFTLTYSVDAESTEEYTAVGTQKRWFKNDVIVEKFTTGTTSFTLSETPVVLKNGDFAISVILDEVYLEEAASGVSPVTGEYEVSGTTLTTFDTRTNQLIAIYQAIPAGVNWADISDATMPAAIRGTDQPVLLKAGGIDRVQSVSLNGAYNPEAVREMGNRDIVGYQSQNMTVNGTITVLDTDTELIALLTTGSLNPADTEFAVSEFTASGISLEIQFQDPADKVLPYTILKTVYVPQITVTSEGFTSNVNQNAQQTFDIKSFDGNIIMYKGERVA